MSKPASWIDELRSECLSNNPFVNAPYFRMLYDGKLTKVQAYGFVTQQYHIVEFGPRVFSRIHSRCPKLEVRKDNSRHLMVEDLGYFRGKIGATPDHVELFKRLCDEFGIKRDDYSSLEMLPETMAVINYLRYLASSAPWEVALATMMIFEDIVLPLSQNMRAPLRKHYGVTDWGGQNYDVHEESEIDEAGGTRVLLPRYILSDEQKQMVVTEGRTFMGQFWLYARGLYRAYVQGSQLESAILGA